MSFLKIGLSEFGIQQHFSKPLQGYFEMDLMFFQTWEVDQDIINKHYRKIVEILSEDPIHQIHENYGGIHQPKCHNHKLKVAVLGAKCNLLHILFSDPQLVIP